jgi:radical SAM family uncharacterized protein/radical SAM-linked protein
VRLGTSNHPYEDFLLSVEKPTRYTGREHGSRIKPWDSVDSHVCLAFPDIYDIGTSHLGFRILYSLLNDHSTILAERCFAPWVDLRRELIARNLPLISLENRRPLCDFDVIGFSLQFELCYTNILSMLSLGRVALRSKDRGSSDPLVLAGGPVGTHAEPMAPFFDAVLIGDGEEAAVEIALDWARTRSLGLTRAERLLSLSKITGVYVPSLYATHLDEQSGMAVLEAPSDSNISYPIRRRVLQSLHSFPFPAKGPVGGPEAVFDRMSIEITRGCTEGCRFCQAGMIYRPVRERPPEQILATIEASIADSGQDEVSLSSLSTADVSYISPLIKSLTRRTAKERVSLGVASLRAYGLSEDLLDEIRQVRATGLTFAPEAGTQRLRDVINKNVTEEQILTTAQQVFSHGWHRMKFYFIMGLPTETDEDLLGIVEVGRKALEIGRRYSRKRPEVTVSVSVHVPKPHTPFQWCAMDTLPEIRRKQSLLRTEVRKVRGLELKLHDPTSGVLECILARGDRRLADAIQSAFEAGAVFDSWDEHFRPELWDAAFQQHGVNRETYLGTIPVVAHLPWGHIDVGLDPDFLPREYRQAMKGRVSPPCGKPLGMHLHHTNVENATADSRKLVCYACGIECDLTQMRDQRVEYLTQLGATKAPEPVTEVAATEEPSAPHEAPEKRRPVRDFATAQRFRFRFGKLESAVFLGHGDLIRELPRILRRAGLRLKYSEGFHPKAELSFAPALSLGIPSLDEYFDAVIMDPPPIEYVLGRLSTEQSGGLWFRGATALSTDDPGLSKLVHAAHYVLMIPASALTEIGGESGLMDRVSDFMTQKSVLVERRKESTISMIDARRFVLRCELASDASATAITPFVSGFSGTLCDLVVSVGQSGSVKPREVLSAVLPGGVTEAGAIRLALLQENGLPLYLKHSEGLGSWKEAPHWGVCGS